MTHEVYLEDSAAEFRARIPEGARLNFPWLARDAHKGIAQAIRRLHLDGYDPERAEDCRNYRLEMHPLQCVAFRRPEWQRVNGGELCWTGERWEYRSKGMCIAYWHRHGDELRCESTSSAYRNGIGEADQFHCETVIEIVDTPPLDWSRRRIAAAIREIAERCHAEFPKLNLQYLAAEDGEISDCNRYLIDLERVTY